MLRFLQMILKRAPLLTAIIVLWIIITILAVAGRGRAYKQYAGDYGKHPAVFVVMRGIHDHVMPWSKGSSVEDGVMTAAKEDNDEKTAGNGDVKEQSDETADVVQEKDAGAGSEEKDVEEEPDTDSKDQEKDKDKDTAGDEDADGNEKKDDQSDSDEKSVSDDTSSEKFLTIPATSCSKVVTAKDYGVAEERYLSPKGTKFNKDTEGLFAPNGIFYELQEVDDKYFSDALFVGDSRTVGLYEYGGMEKITSFLARESTTVYDLFDDDEMMDYIPMGKKTIERTFKDLLTKAKFRKIYLSVGVNELGIPDTLDYYKEFRKVVARIHKLQPDAIIYIQAIMHVSKSKSKSDPVFNNTAIVQRNQAISTLANGRNIFYIDMNGELCDKDGNLKDELTGDGIHLKASACPLWHTFLKKNAIVLPD